MCVKRSLTHIFPIGSYHQSGNLFSSWIAGIYDSSTHLVCWSVSSWNHVMGCLDDQLEDSKHPELTYLDLQQRPVFFHQKKKTTIKADVYRILGRIHIIFGWSRYIMLDIPQAWWFVPLLFWCKCVRPNIVQKNHEKHSNLPNIGSWL